MVLAWILNCSISLNLTLVSQTVIPLPLVGPTPVGETVQHEFKIAEQNGVYELQAYDTLEPSRTYSLGRLSQPGDSVELTIWKREFLLTGRCEYLPR